MTKVTMNQENLEAAIESLRTLARDCETSRDNIVGYYNDDGDTLEKAGYREPEDFTSNVNTAVQALRDRATTIETYKDKIVELNESGVASMDANGVITLALPDDVTFPEDPDNFASWAQGVIDADDLKHVSDGGGQRPSRTYDQIVASIRAHSSDPAYADAVITEIGPENLTSFPATAAMEDADWGSDPDGAIAKLASLFGSLIASASTGHGSWPGWSEDKCQQVAKAIKESVDESDEYDRIPILNFLFGDHDADGDHVNDLKFSRNLLVDLANELDDIDLSRVRERMPRYSTIPFLSDHPYDPLTGVLDAMGNNRFAALAYLAPSTDDGGVDASRIDELAKRDWDRDGMAGFAAALAAGSSLRGSTVGNQANRARELSGHAIAGLAENTTEDLYDDDAKASIAMLLANCRGELTDALAGGRGYDDVLLKQLPGVTSDEIRALTYRVVDSADAMATLSAGIGDWAHQASQIRIAETPDDPESKMTAIETQYQQSAAAIGFLVGMADAKADTITEDKENAAKASSQNAKLAYSIFTVVATAGLGAVGGPVGAVIGSTAGKAVVSVGLTLAAPLVTESDKVQRVVSTASGTDLMTGTKAAAIAEAANAGLLDSADYSSITGTSNTVDPSQPDFIPYGWLRPENADPSRPNIDISRGEGIVEGKGKDGIVGTSDDSIMTPEEQVLLWASGVSSSTSDGRLKRLTDAADLGKASRYEDGTKQNGDPNDARNPG